MDQLPLCKCGCGQRVSKLSNKYIQGHNTRNIQVSNETKKKLSILKKGKTWEEIYGKDYTKYFKEKRKNDLTGKTYEELHGIKKGNLIKEKISKSNKGKTISKSHKKIISETQKDKIVSKEQKNKQRQKMLGKKHSKDTKRKITESLKGNANSKLSISHIKERYPFFAQIEEMRYNPDKPGEKEIQVHCKNHLCCNSKEKGGWFTPSRTQLYERIRQLEKDYGNDGCYFYCSDECKNECPLYNLQSDPLQNIEKNYTSEEYQQFRQHVLERDNNICQYCGEQADHVHHERPQKLEPFFSLDPDYAWSCCKKCHYEKGHQGECSTGNLANIICKKEIKND